MYNAERFGGDFPRQSGRSIDSVPAGLCLKGSRFSWVHMHGGPGALSGQRPKARPSYPRAHSCSKTPEIVLSGTGDPDASSAVSRGGGVASMLTPAQEFCVSIVERRRYEVLETSPRDGSARANHLGNTHVSVKTTTSHQVWRDCVCRTAAVAAYLQDACREISSIRDAERRIEAKKSRAAGPAKPRGAELQLRPDEEARASPRKRHTAPHISPLFLIFVKFPQSPPSRVADALRTSRVGC